MTFTPDPSYFGGSLAEVDPEVAAALDGETARQAEGIDLIASENFVSRATLDALASPMVNKTVEGYAGARYYGGVAFADQIERLAIKRAKELFAAGYANVQPHSGSQANLAVFFAFLQPGATVLSMDLSAGGHLSHGANPNISGKWMNIEHYGVDARGFLDYDQVRDVAVAARPELIIAGGSSYPRAIDFATFRNVADEVDATLLVDMAHWAGLVAAGVHENPVPIADVVTTTTYKNLRGARGGLVLSHREDLTPKLNSAVFPGVQGSVILNAVAAKAVCLGEALAPEFKAYGMAVLDNARSLAAALADRGWPCSPAAPTHRSWWPTCAPAISPARLLPPLSKPRDSPQTKTVCPPTPSHPRSPAVYASGPRPEQHAASTPQHSPRSATGSPTCSKPSQQATPP